MVEMLVVFFILLILLSIFVPYALHLREHRRRLQCADNLRQLFGALQNYANDNASMMPRTRHDPSTVALRYNAFTGNDSPDAFAADTNVQANDVTASYWLLYRIGYLTKSDYFVCDGDEATPDRTSRYRQRSNFSSRLNLSYSFATPFSANPEYKLTSDLPSSFALVADLNPNEGEGRSTEGDADKNSKSHRGAGQNVLYAYGAVEFKSTPKCAVANDNIYTLSRTVFTTAPATTPSTAPATQAVFNLTPWDSNDSYLVPTAGERR